MEINWTVLTYFVIGIFALNGFFRGWWKEAVTIIILAAFVFFLQQPGIAEIFVEFLNTFIETIWQVLPDSVINFINDILQIGLGIRSGSAGPRLDPGDAGTWLLLLIAFLAIVTLAARIMLPNYGRRAGYAVRPAGGLLGALLGGLNGFIIISLVREYLDGRSLPGVGDGAPPTEIAQTAGGGTVGITSSDIGIRAVEVPSFTILDSFLPWIIIIIAVAVFLMALKNRVAIVKNEQGFRRVEYRPPYGYERYG